MSAPASAAVLIIENDILMGASGVNVLGTLYNVEFLDGTYTDIFGTSPLTFKTEADAVAASNALLSQVFVNSALGQFDDILSGSTIYFTNGCSFPSFCSVVTTYLSPDPIFNEIFSTIAVRNNLGKSNDIVPTFNHFADENTESFPSMTYARWSVAPSAVPEPETYAMFLAGLGLMGFASRRKLAR